MSARLAARTRRAIAGVLIAAGLALAALRAPEGGVTSNAGAYQLEYEVEGGEIPWNELFAIDVRVFDAGEERRPAADVELAFDARMPEHRHGMRRRPLIVARGGGAFRVEGARLHMPGRWELHFDVTRGAVTERAQVEVLLD